MGIEPHTERIQYDSDIHVLLSSNRNQLMFQQITLSLLQQSL